MKSLHYSRFVAARQRGAVLVVSLLLLLVMTLLGLGASQSTRLQERMAGNQRDQEIALQTAEASLRAAEIGVSPTNPAVVTCRAPGTTCDAYEMRTFVDGDGVPLDLAKQADTWWNSYGRDYQFTANLGDVATTPEYTVERFAEVREVLSVGDSTLDTVRDFYRASARATGMTNTSQVVIQSTYARISFE